MDSLKLVPQVFFDLIARVVPGAAGIIAYLLIIGLRWDDVLEKIMGESLATKSPTLTILLFFASAYVVGQLLSPAAKLIQRIGEKVPCKPVIKRRGAYDRLRLQAPPAGAFCAKIRAEFLMHNGLAAVLFFSAAVYVLKFPDWRWPVLLSLLLGAILTAYRGHSTRNTFQETVIKFDNALREQQKKKKKQSAS